MAKMVGLSRNIKLVWLNKTVEFINEGLSGEELKSALHEYLSYEIKSKDNLRKTRDILLRLWSYENEDLTQLRKDALATINTDSDNALAANWALMLVAYPVFADICKLVGKMSEYQDEITLSQLKQKMFDEWGERTTLYHSMDKIIATLKDFGVLKSDRPGKYVVTKKKIKNDSVTLLLLKAAMKSSGEHYYSIPSLSNMSVLFPFEYTPKMEVLLNDKSITNSSFDGKVSFMIS